MAAAFTADYEGLRSIHRKDLGVVYLSAQPNRQTKRKDMRTSQPVHLSLAKMSLSTGLRAPSAAQQSDTLRRGTVDFSVIGCTAGGGMRTQQAKRMLECSEMSVFIYSLSLPTYL
ncbi:hypothetical protein WMY93_003860 [Mugilogobius chulae]|uniref:Uncharacterized protein n=1 Tax=Mugilogobius chulae TaxID=88201 RepID=A0AAW0Q0S3_9GOBI